MKDLPADLAPVYFLAWVLINVLLAAMFYVGLPPATFRVVAAWIGGCQIVLAALALLVGLVVLVVRGCWR